MTDSARPDRPSDSVVSAALWAKIRPNWTPILGNCNAQFYFTADASVRCTGVEHHDGLHRCHYDTGPQKAMFMWGDEKQHTDLAALVDTDLLCLVRRSV